MQQEGCYLKEGLIVIVLHKQLEWRILCRLIKKNPYNPRNRRISIIVLNKEAEQRLRSLSDAVPVEDLSKKLRLTPQ